MSDRPGRYLRRRAEQLFRAHTGSENTQAAIAYDLANFLTFLWSHRHPLGRRGWRDAEPDDRAAYQHWRRSDENGPGVQGSTWSREVATVNCFTAGPSTAASSSATRSFSGRYADGPAPACALVSKHRPRHRTTVAVTTWPDFRRRPTGAGATSRSGAYLASGLRDASFRERNAARNGTFCDLMVRTGLRLSEQNSSSLTLFEIPDMDRVARISRPGCRRRSPRAAPADASTSPRPCHRRLGLHPVRAG